MLTAISRFSGLSMVLGEVITLPDAEFDSFFTLKTLIMFSIKLAAKNIPFTR